MSNTRSAKHHKRGSEDGAKRGKGKSEWIRGSVKHLRRSGELKKLPKPRTSTCYLTGKVRFTDEDTALRALVNAVSARLSSKAERVESRAYYCQYCDGWHLTSVRDTSAIKTGGVEIAAKHQDAFKVALSQVKCMSEDARATRKEIQHFMLAMDREKVPVALWTDPWLWAAVNELKRSGTPASVLSKQFPVCLARAYSIDSSMAEPDDRWLPCYGKMTKTRRAELMGAGPTPIAVVAAFQAVKQGLEEDKSEPDAVVVSSSVEELVEHHLSGDGSQGDE